ncbi:hypothetical protein pdam_00000960 [Pocillopora damicornis]|uniref:Deoxyribonuclease TATDN1 n=2 Tax=Pocillopora damicornis TaxID=46731 RepID=A0A3M6T6B1_POCDA|nr:uncharacterized protein LOC113682062 isoform X1 [Pocillopora damicornis]RMX36956.1 hypothetical protein pdam_00000960 [Pocillopora damicornis]
MSTNRRFYIGNLSLKVTKDDLRRHFGLDSTPYLRSNSWIELPVERPGMSHGFGFINVPEQLASHLLQLNGTKLYDRFIKVEPANTQMGGRRSKVSIPSMFPSSYVMPIPQLANYPYGMNQYSHNMKGRRNRQFLQGPNEIVTVPEDRILQLIDVGVNLPNKAFSRDIRNVIEQADLVGIKKMILTGNTLQMSQSAVLHAKAHPHVLYASVGVHPHFTTKEWNEKTAREIEELAKDPVVVAIGEVGLDFHRNYSDEKAQVEAFTKQVEIACEVQKPLLAHERASHQKFIEVLSHFSGRLPSIVIHCFTGSVSEMSAYVAMGFYIGICGFICKDSPGKALRDALKEGVLPLDRILLESDAPYMIPNAPEKELDDVCKSLLKRCQPGRNEPCTLPIVAHTVAKCLGVDAEEVARASTENARRVFDLKLPVPTTQPAPTAIGSE